MTRWVDWAEKIDQVSDSIDMAHVHKMRVKNESRPGSHYGLEFPTTFVDQVLDSSMEQSLGRKVTRPGLQWLVRPPEAREALENS